MFRLIVKTLWVLPSSIVGLGPAIAIVLLGGEVRRNQGTLEVTYRKRFSHCGHLTKSLPFRGITFGHVILAVTEEELERLRAHERVHVRQYERWGIFFFPAYLGSSLWQLVRGRRAYWDNYFEVQARRESSRSQG